MPVPALGIATDLTAPCDLIVAVRFEVARLFRPGGRPMAPTQWCERHCK